MTKTAKITEMAKRELQLAIDRTNRAPIAQPVTRDDVNKELQNKLIYFKSASLYNKRTSLGELAIQEALKMNNLRKKG